MHFELQEAEEKGRAIDDSWSALLQVVDCLKVHLGLGVI